MHSSSVKRTPKEIDKDWRDTSTPHRKNSVTNRKNSMTEGKPHNICRKSLTRSSSWAFLARLPSSAKYTPTARGSVPYRVLFAPCFRRVLAQG